MNSAAPIQTIRQLSPPAVNTPPLFGSNTAYPNYSSTSQNSPPITFKIKAHHQDPVTKQYFILWSEVQIVIKGADYAIFADDGTVVPFMVNEAFEE